jgi:hypothetical protein
MTLKVTAKVVNIDSSFSNYVLGNTRYGGLFTKSSAPVTFSAVSSTTTMTIEE